MSESRSSPPPWVHELPVVPGPPWVSMGVRALDLDTWFLFDDHTARELAYKRELATDRPTEVFVAEEGSEGAGAEVLETVGSWLDRHRGEHAAAATPTQHPLEAAAHLVPEDLCVLIERDGRCVLTAAAVSFPSHWRIADKLGRGLGEIHQPVHHYEFALAAKVDTFLARLTPSRPVVRRNVSVHDHNTLFRPEPPEEFDHLDVAVADLWLRSERQTLVRLPRSGAVLFTIKTQQCPVTTLAGAPTIAMRLAAKYRALLIELDRLGDAAPVPRWLPDVLERLATAHGS